MYRYQRKNGFSLPFNYYQIISWLLVLFQTAVSCVIVIPLLKGYHQALCASLLLSTLVILVLFWFKVSKADLIDNESYSKESSVMCKYCCSNVSTISKHCRICNKCIRRFDHHCKILNNCIGKDNYRNFIGLLLAVLLFNTTLAGYSGLLILSFALDENQYWSDVKINKTSSICLSVIAFIESIIFLFSDLMLLLFHGYLKIKNLTTFEYITQKKTNRIESLDADNINKTEIVVIT